MLARGEHRQGLARESAAPCIRMGFCLAATPVDFRRSLRDLHVSLEPHSDVGAVGGSGTKSDQNFLNQAHTSCRFALRETVEFPGTRVHHPHCPIRVERRLAATVPFNVLLSHVSLINDRQIADWHLNRLAGSLYQCDFITR